MKKIVFISLALSLVLAFSSCKKDKDNPDGIVNFGYISGKVYTPSGVPVPAASIFVDDHGEIYFARTDKNGYFYLRAPEGERELNVQGGDGSLFRSVYTITIEADEVTELPDNYLKISQAVELAYIPGAYDRIETILIDSMGYTADMLSVSDLDNPTLLASYGAIFLNCGKSGVLDSAKYANMEEYIMNGGNIYASDYAVEYLTGDGYYTSNINVPIVQHNHHGDVPNNNMRAGCNTPEIGGFIDDATLCTDKEGPATMVNQAEIVDTLIQAFLGKTHIDIEYDLGAWEVVKDITAPWEILIQDPVYGPLAARMNIPTAATVRNQLDQGWVTICHFPPGNPGNVQTITISVNALPAHLAHGDYVGSCLGGAGTIFFTTFHNHVQGDVGPDVYQMLQYFIMNL